MEEHFNCYVHISVQCFFSVTKTEWFTTDAVIKRFLFFHRKGF